MPKPIDKVLAYLTRENRGKTQVLVFEHVGTPEAGLQVPAGTVEPGEDIYAAVLREIHEESGLTLKTTGTLLGRFDWHRADRNENHLRHIFLFETTEKFPDHWVHDVGGTGEDENLKFRFRWIDLEQARTELAVDQGKYLWVSRQACRAILLTPAREVLLIKIANPDGSWTGWITPGGGVDPGETEFETLARELKEELGFTLDNPAPCVWRRSTRYPWNGKVYEQHERFFLVQTPKFDPTQNVSFTEAEQNEIKEVRWWPLAEIQQSKEKFAPQALAQQIENLLDGGMPQQPIDVGR